MGHRLGPLCHCRTKGPGVASGSFLSRTGQPDSSYQRRYLTNAASRPSDFLTVSQAAHALGVHPNTVRTWTAQGVLPCLRINGRGDRRYRRDDLASFVHRASGAPARIRRNDAATMLADANERGRRADQLLALSAELGRQLDPNLVLTQLVERTAATVPRGPRRGLHPRAGRDLPARGEAQPVRRVLPALERATSRPVAAIAFDEHRVVSLHGHRRRSARRRDAPSVPARRHQHGHGRAARWAMTSRWVPCALYYDKRRTWTDADVTSWPHRRAGLDRRAQRRELQPHGDLGGAAPLDPAARLATDPPAQRRRDRPVDLHRAEPADQLPQHPRLSSRGRRLRPCCLARRGRRVRERGRRTAPTQGR